MQTSQNTHVAQLRKAHTNILHKIEKLSELNVQYRNNQEKQFMKTFLHIMDRMSNQLSKAQQQYDNIDKEIQKDQKCIELSTKLAFFKDQCLTLRLQLEKTQSQIADEKYKQKQILKQNLQLQSNLFNKSKQLLRYKAKALSLAKRQTEISEKNQYNNNSKIYIDTTQSLDSPVKLKKHSLSQTKNTKMTDFQKIQKFENHIQCPLNIRSTEIQFRIKAAKMAKQRKLMMNKTTYINLEKDANSNKKQNQLSQLLKL